MKERTITITRKITDDDLINILCGATSTACAGWCWKVDYDSYEYAEAREQLLSVGNEERDICFEDVLLQMLKNRSFLSFYDVEEKIWRILDMDRFIKGIELYMSSEYCSSHDIDDWDDTDFDNVIQYSFFGEIVYG